MKIFSVEQIRNLDQYTIEHEPIPSIDLMERASRTFVQWFSEQFPDRKKQVFVFCGPGNNGGDGLAIARMLSQDHYEVKTFLLRIGNQLSPDCQANLDRIRQERCCTVEEFKRGNAFPVMHEGSVLIDAIFGSGLSRPIVGFWEKFVQHLNHQRVVRVSVDIPSGMFADQPTQGTSILADRTFSFEMPKLGFIFPENAERVGEWQFGSIGLHPDFIQKEPTPWHLLDDNLAKVLLRPRKKYDHKGTFGHALLVVGSYGKMGAAILASRGALRAGAGLMTVHVPQCGYDILQIANPEAMVMVDEEAHSISKISADLSSYTAFGIGCGIGNNYLTVSMLGVFLESVTLPVVLDADALNILAEHPEFFEKIPKSSILTPHPKEFERLFGKTADSFERNDLQRKKAEELGVYIVLKGANTAIACPDGTCYFNTTGNPGMATAGSGDVLTGILTGLLSQGYSPKSASLLGVYLHGLAGDLAATEMGEEGMLAGDLLRFLGRAFQFLR